MTAGFEFYQNRDTLGNMRSWAQLIASAKELDGLFVVGDTVTREQIDLHKVRRMLLPNPQSASVAFFAATMKQPEISDIIRRSTKAAQERGIDVKWLDEFVGYSLILLNKNDEDARVHVELVLAPMVASKRPSFTVWKRRFPSVFTEFRSAFDSLWERAKSPSL
jgi:hypothetical protein